MSKARLRASADVSPDGSTARLDALGARWVHFFSSSPLPTGQERDGLMNHLHSL